MPMHRNMPNFVDKNHKNPTFVKDKNLMSEKGLEAEAIPFVRRPDSATLIKKVPDAKIFIN